MSGPASGQDRIGVPPAEAVPLLYARFMRWTPLLWLGGILTLGSIAMLGTLTLRRWPGPGSVRVVIGAWFSIALAQAFSALLNGISQGDVGLGVRNLLSFAVIGWAFGALAIAAGASWHLGTRQAARWVALLGCYTLALAVVALVARALGATALRLTTPLNALFPNSAIVQFYASVAVFQREETLGESVTRLVLFYPWAPALGIGSVAVGLISSRAVDRRLRWAGMVGGLVGVVFSWGRLAIAAAAVVAVVNVLLRMPRWSRWVGLTLVCAALWALEFFDRGVLSLLEQGRAAADGARAGSSLARQLIYDKSWEAFLQSPLIGHGWIGESVHRTEVLPIGSHSTFYGLLYTGGVVTFACFVVAMASTLLAIVASLRQAASADARDDARVALCLWLLLALCAPYESIFSLTLPCLAIFTWIGGVIGTARAPSAVVTLQRMRRATPPALRQADSAATPTSSIVQKGGT